MMRCPLVLALMICGVGGSRFCSRDDADIVSAIQHEIRGAMNPQSMIDLTTDAFVRLMEAYPVTKQLFTRVKGDDPTSPEFAAHAYRVVNAFNVFVPSLNDTAVLEELASHLARQHAGRTGVKREHFAFLGKVIDRSLRGLASNFNPDAWESCFNPVIHTIVADLP